VQSRRRGQFSMSKVAREREKERERERPNCAFGSALRVRVTHYGLLRAGLPRKTIFFNNHTYTFNNFISFLYGL
jgi:hypothetical protein